MAFAERLKVRGKPSILIVGAVMTRLLHIIHGALEHGRPFNPNTTKMRKSPVDFNAVSDPNATIIHGAAGRRALSFFPSCRGVTGGGAIHVIHHSRRDAGSRDSL
jgi:hypothetical protein